MDENFKGKQVASVSLGITVICLYGFFVIMVAFGFGSYIYRTGWKLDAKFAEEGQALATDVSDIDSLLYVLSSEKDIRRNQALLLASIQSHRNEVSELDGKIAQSFSLIARTRAAWQAEVDQATGDLEEYQFELPGGARTRFEAVVSQMDAAEVSGLTQAENLSVDHRIRTLLAVAAKGFEDSAVDLDTKDRFTTLYARTIKALDTLANAHKTANEASLDLQAQRKSVQDKLLNMQANREVLDDKLANLEKILPIGHPARARLSLLSLNVPYMPDILMRLVSFPTIFLTLIVTIAAGGLGTVVAFSRRYYSSATAASLTLSRLFVNVGEGIAAAIAIFLFSGAGMLALTQGSGPANEVELSPYTVAFVAFLSGFMAEDAFASIQAAGKRIFNQNAAENGSETASSKEPTI